MANRILFEDDIIDTEVNKTNESNINQEIKMKEEKDGYGSQVLSEEESQDSLETNVIILGTKINKDDEENTSQEEGYKTQDEDKNSQKEVSQEEDNVPLLGEGKPKSKRRIKSELEWLLLDTKKDPEGSEEGYDVFGDESTLFRKYKLRKTEQAISYKEPADIKLKRRNSDDDPDLTCPVCKEELANKVDLLNHLRIHNKSVHGYTCSLCSEKFDKNVDLIAHRQKHSGESFLCQECKLAFSNYCDYLQHNYDHLNQPHFKCSECGLRYRKSAYKKHIRTHFENHLSCNLCSFVTTSRHELQTHLNQHNNRYACVECGKVCNSKTHYDYHMGVHTGVKKVQCLYCGACFSNKANRDVHTRTHTGEKPYTCDICGHKSRQWTDHARHKQSHATQKTFVCDLCGNKYLHRYSLITHMRSHTRKSLYKCPECGDEFTSVTGLKTHSMFKHMSERPVECTLCDKKFINDNQYRKHCRAKYHLRNVFGQNVNVETKE
ncbi:hypothetical protein PYW08_012474 [Mythimna loreyi]|uniref:Uncharacterized protein n=1 Tax=Mythimna loreyi TaxID=667449 RepID=A0ACC2Q5B9_9NEOP|nr:hypothetical protein PYW08_012474 [Mythimna loreyi]